ncbi:MAG: hypothetical protein Q7J42_01685 [Sulfuritalea sp.]|nr:hypothetical protein [Sulfuritalea sp.]
MQLSACVQLIGLAILTGTCQLLQAFPARAPGSVETTNAVDALRTKLSALTPDPEALRAYIMDNYLALYELIGRSIHLLAIRHQRQISFDFESHWGANSSTP